MGGDGCDLGVDYTQRIVEEDVMTRMEGIRQNVERLIATVPGSPEELQSMKDLKARLMRLALTNETGEIAAALDAFLTGPAPWDRLPHPNNTIEDFNLGFSMPYIPDPERGQ